MMCHDQAPQHHPAQTKSVQYSRTPKLALLYYEVGFIKADDWNSFTLIIKPSASRVAQTI